MSRSRPPRRVLLTGLLTTSIAIGSAQAQTTDLPSTYAIDLPTVLRLAHAQNVDVLIAQQRLVEARASHQRTLGQFFPWIAPGVNLRRHEGRTQAVDGTLLDVDKQSIALGASLNAEVDLSNLLFDTLAAKQLVTAAAQSVDAVEQDTTVDAAQSYFELLKAKALVDVVRDALRTSQDYGAQIQAAVGAGVAFKGDELRVQTQTQRYQLAITQSLEQQRVASARLAQVLHLDPLVELLPTQSELVPITLIDASPDAQPFVKQALASRPELKRHEALIAAAREAERSAKYGPLLPKLSVQAFLGEFGGGEGDTWGNRGDSEDYYVGLQWRFGPGGLFDINRIHVTQAQLATAELSALKSTDEIARHVVERHARVRSLSEQIATSRMNLSSAQETLRLTRERKQLGVGVVLEDIQAQQELVRARADYLSAIAEFNKAQYALSKAVGAL